MTLHHELSSFRCRSGYPRPPKTNVCASASHIVETLSLVPGDRCTNIMPLFHIHGLISAVLSSLAAGASIYCTPGFNALRVFAWWRSPPCWVKSALPSWVPGQRA